ncbi:PDDEXK-like family protein [Sediminispirochaeta smaragdinae]|uniref:Uncharacterized protein n=1 Tax=Sediminispirochaeta smaragdinae (strain DSM 11293 / JCM 15392 / SEBR 4228) TaxID=573413 RepID=E1RB17_SEDSS|nr:hypothetical protein [Sediminispirochaeta smaragdinae]ADK79547.1 hypothetical protein Spirs_0392 [Sediminispirochaeta smaragdinae DSM 11293]
MKTIELFFRNLSEKKYKESDFSDIIASLCNASESFTRIFIDYLFDNKYHEVKGLSVYREFTSEDKKSTIDFKIEDENGCIVCLIENKINDKDDHFEKYMKSFRNEIGFIANYKIENKKDHYKYSKTWPGFYKYIEEKLDNFNDCDRLLINGFRKYIQGVCGIMNDIEKFNLSDIGSLEDLHSYLRSLVQQKDGCKINTNKKSITEYRHGIDFEYKNTELWFGVYTASYSKNLHIGFKAESNINLTEKFKKALLEEGEYYVQPYYEENGNECWFELKDEYYETLVNDKVPTKLKLEIIKNFFDEALSLI